MLFPADTVYGLATEPDNRARAIERIYGLKGRPPERPAAIMFFAVDDAARSWPAHPRGARTALCPAVSRSS